MIIRYERLIRSLASDCGIDTVTRDYVLSRYKAEGVSFLTVTLPKFSASILNAVACGRINDPDQPRTCCTAFQLKTKSRVPKFFSGLRYIFTRNGKLKEDYNPLYVKSIRQFCEYFYKIAFSFTEGQIEKATASYIAEEHSLGSLTFDASHVTSLRKNLETYYGLTEQIDEILHRYRPRLTSGSFRGSENVCEKSHARHWSEFKLSRDSLSRVPDSFRAYSWARKPYPGLKLRDWVTTVRKPVLRPELGSSMPGWPNNSIITKRGSLHDFVVEADRRCEVLFVPKDSRGPRTISKEPLGSLPYQMAYFDYMVDKLETVTDHRINFRDQSINRDLARRGSLGEGWSTFDLKSASDRVHSGLISRLFAYLPVRKFLDLRSTHAILTQPDDTKIEIKLNKLAGMGSGLTFPTMALLIHLAVCTEISEQRRIPYQKVMKQVYVYGDDLILPDDFSTYVEPALTKVGMKLNLGKSFWTGDFRESCGGDYLKGVDISPVRLKLSGARLRPHKRTIKIPSWLRKRDQFVMDLSKGGDLVILQLERHCRELVKAHLINTAEYLYSRIEKEVGSLPYVSGCTAVLGRYTLDEFSVLAQGTPVNRAKSFIMKQINTCFTTRSRFYKTVRGPEQVVNSDLVPSAVILRFRDEVHFATVNDIPDNFLLLGRALQASSTSNPYWWEDLIVEPSAEGVAIPFKIKLQRIAASNQRRLGAQP